MTEVMFEILPRIIRNSYQNEPKLSLLHWSEQFVIIRKPNGTRDIWVLNEKKEWTLKVGTPSKRGIFGIKE
jgi:hypothetical protein